MTSDSVVWPIRVGDEETTAVWDPAHDDSVAPVFVCAHGAGGHMDDRSLTAITSGIRARGISTVRFNFLYRARRSGRPDPMPRLLECFEAVIARVREEIYPPTLILGGRSMGGRVASMLASRGAPCEGLLLLAYPLHPPGQHQKLRIDHLPAIQVPVLCLNGTRDAFCDRALMQQVQAGLGANWRMHWLEAADHSFHVLKRSGRTDDEVLTEAADEIAKWNAELLVHPRVHRNVPLD